MANAVFSSSVTYTPSGGGSLTQGFRVAFAYTASSAGTVDVAAGSSAAVDIVFGSVSEVLGFVLQNNTDKDIAIKVGANTFYSLAAGGVLMHWSPAKSASSLTGVKATPDSPTNAGTIEFVVLGN
ncbi:hypothetical protein [Corallococcus carmarthensis]|uniref:hypothetical protein n=1 Tax=Corallococcus carmarthensis TaxID=2316728 RepID=UPI0011C3BAC0|nr:hypothetical protein [Corallococcus carmarthensis]NOK16270.1 hypothetical protein [Corallococcus carmarthensis]